MPDRRNISVERTEKAGVGGSTPSLATMVSITSKHRKPQFCPILSQKMLEACRGVCLSMFPAVYHALVVTAVLRHGFGVSKAAVFGSTGNYAGDETLLGESP